MLQYEAVELIRQTGVLGLRVPTEFGGPGGKARDVLSAVIQIGRGSSNVAQALRSHFGFSERLLSNRATRQEREEWFPRVYAGHRRRQRDHRRGGQSPVERGHQGASRYGRGAAAQRLQVLLHRHAVRRRHRGICAGCRWSRRAGDHSGRSAGVELFDDWDGFGQRTTASGGTRFTEVEVHPDEVVTVSEGNTLGHATAFLQLYLASVAVGIAYAVLDDAVEYVRTKARPASHSVADSAATDPFVLEAVGEISAAAASSAEAIVLTAADAIDQLVDNGRQHDPDAVADVAVTVAKAQLVAERLTISAAGQALRHRRGVGHRPHAEP